MRKWVMIWLVIGLIFGFANAQAQWHESFSTNATPDANGKIKSDLTWQWWAWGTAAAADGALQLTGAKDPFGNTTCWVQIDQSVDANAAITPTDYEMYVKVKITTASKQDNDDQFHVAVQIDPDFMSNLNVYTVVSVPKDNAIGIYYFAEDKTEIANVNPAITYDKPYWEKIKVQNGNISVWVFADGAAPAADPDIQYTQTTVASPAPTLIMVGSFYNDSSKVSIDEVYYNEAPPALAVNENPTSMANDFSLEQNYPNPFNPTTSITYSLKTREKTTLRVYNAEGKLMSTLVNGMVSAGVHKVTWNAAHLPSGIYFYKLQTPKFTQTKKMLLVK